MAGDVHLSSRNVPNLPEISFETLKGGLLRIFETAHSGNIHLIKKKISPVSPNEQQGSRSTLMKSVIFSSIFQDFY